MGVQEVYDYYRQKSLTWAEWSKNLSNESEKRQYQAMMSELANVFSKHLGTSGNQTTPQKKPRIIVDAASGTVEVDNTVYAGIDYHDCLIIAQLVKAKGAWISRAEMQERDPQLLNVLRIDRNINKSIKRKHNGVGNLIEVDKKRRGYRIIPAMFN